MFEAKSMYFGGEIINASDCNYTSTRELGIVCPFCSSAVFLRSHSTREVKGKIQLVRPYFAHYPTGNGDEFDCEKRSHTKQGKERIEQVKIQARNQRLKLYNAHLWDMIAESHEITHQQLNKARSTFGERWLESNSVLVRHEWRDSLSGIYALVDTAIKYLCNQANDVSNLAGKEHYLLQCDIDFHQIVCNEVSDFLATNSAGFVFLKLFKYCLYRSLLVGQNSFSVSDWKRINHVAHLSTMTMVLASTRWAEMLNKRLV
jgi:hypothetical protein